MARSRSRSRSRSLSRGEKRKLRLTKLTKSPIKGKKLRATFSDGTHTDFGAVGYSDFTKHHDNERKQRYISRHKSRENFQSPKSRGALSRWILWNKSSIKSSLADYRRRFKM